MFQVFFKPDGGSRKPLPELCDVYAGWGNFLCKLSRRFGHQFSSVSQIALLLPAVESEAYTHSPFAPRLFSESTKDMILQVFQQNNHSTATCHSNVPGGYFTVGAGSIVRERMGGTLLGQHCSEAAYVYLYRCCVYKDFVACWIRADSTCHKICSCQQLLRGQIMCRQPAAATSCEAAERCANRRKVTPY